MSDGKSLSPGENPVDVDARVPGRAPGSRIQCPLSQSHAIGQDTMNELRFLLGLADGVCLLLASAACSSYADDCTNTNSCGAAVAGADGSATTGSGGSGATTGQKTGGQSSSGGCDPESTPSQDVCVITDALGVFVSPQGNDTAVGSKSDPVKTVGRALTLAKTSGKRVYACGDAGDYAESVTVGASLDGVAVFGGFSCDDFTYVQGLKTTIVAASPTAWIIEDLTIGAHLEDLDIQAAEASLPGESSFGLIVRDSQNVVLRRVKATAGAGAAGAKGADGVAGASGTAAGDAQDGADGSCSSGGETELGGAWTAASTCGSRGGDGGTGYSDGTAGDGEPGVPTTGLVTAVLDNGGSGSDDADEDGASGADGSDGAPGAPGAPAPLNGAFSASGFTPANGLAGSNGNPGQGGGGGGAGPSVSNECRGASGGAGGMGGCGGTGGAGGGGGGASIGVFIWASSVTLDSCEFVSSDGGAGGAGGQGGTGGAGAVGGSGGDGSGTGLTADAGDGGSGGAGGPGGSGSGGSGGPSAALVKSASTAQELGSIVTVPGDGGAGGPGGLGPVAGPSGSPGTSVAELAS